MPIEKILSHKWKGNKMVFNVEHINISHIAYSMENECERIIFIK